MIPDLERVASAWLRERLDVRVVGRPPADTAAPWVRVIQLDAQDEPNSRAEHLINYLLQFDCYAGNQGGQPEANTLGRRVRELLHQMPGIHNGTVVTAVRIAGDVRLADDTLTPTRERRILSATVWAHGV